MTSDLEAIEGESEISSEIEVSKRFAKKNDEVRAYYLSYKDSEYDLGIKVNELALITKEENPKWTLNKIANFICMVNQDLDGFSRSSVLKNVTEENKILLDVKVTKPKGLPSPSLEQFRQQKGKQEETKLQNNVTEQKNFSKNSIVPEESSITNVVIEDEEIEVIYDDPVKQLEESQKAYEELLRQYEELEQKYEQVIIPFEAKGSVIAPNGQEIPIIGKVNPCKKTISFEIDQKEVKKLKRF